METERKGASSFREPETAGLAFQQPSPFFSVPVIQNYIAETFFAVVFTGFIGAAKIIKLQRNLHAEVIYQKSCLVKKIINEMGTRGISGMQNENSKIKEMKADIQILKA